MPFDLIAARAAELPQDRSTPLAMYCMSSNMSAIAGAELTALGYTDVVELRGGMGPGRLPAARRYPPAADKIGLVLVK